MVMNEQPTKRGQTAPEPFDPTITPRPALMWFAQRMEAKLRTNDHKSDWHIYDYPYLFMRLGGEARELDEAIATEFASPKMTRENLDAIINEAADVANFAMMIADVAEQRKKHLRESGGEQ